MAPKLIRNRRLVKVLRERDVFDWFSRYRQRQRDLAAGVDADLVAGNRKKGNLGLSLVVVGFLVFAASARSHSAITEALRWLGGAMLLVGFFIVEWARQERAFLNKPDPKKPPSLFK
jgi:hypothetical protein